MADLQEVEQPNRSALRVAVEGCGHGTLDAIYASIHKSCEIKGWDGVDLVIIGGDFQAVRDRYDLNVTAMPAKYREMADFHHYYWGAKRAPFLTIFIGGNHEASNHLFELYYGGWVAPNIYYLGAANVIRVGPLKIAAMSGIWKGYDYQKPHFERLPYSHDDMYSIYHVRELDVRKLLAYRTQVDIGISHDWPQGIEWHGDHQQLFRYKPYFLEDAKSGKLGNVAANKVLERLRPLYWFSAHMHTRYAALKTHVSTQKDNTNSNKKMDGTTREISPPLTAEQNKISAWQSFHSVARENEAKETAQILQAQKARQEEARRTGIPLSAGNVYNETYKKVKVSEGCSRAVTSVSQHNGASIQSSVDTADNPIVNSKVDGCCESLPTKRHQSTSPPRRGASSGVSNAEYLSVTSDDANQAMSNTASASNPDAIDIDMSDDDEEDEAATLSHLKQSTQQSETVLPAVIFENESKPNFSNDGPTDQVRTSASSLPQAANEDENETVSEEMRARLAALSTKFAAVEKVQISGSLPHPEGIQNERTRFLALSKCAPGQQFLELLEISSCANAEVSVEGPIKLQYDPEWLAILRVFANELTLGGSSKDPVPRHRGDTHYRNRILEEEKWVLENIVEPDLLDVPENFEITLSQSDVPVSDGSDMPKEQTNPQTQSFCNLIGIENYFDFSEEDREARRVAGPSQSSERSKAKGEFKGGRNFRGGRGGGRGRGRGRGQGRGRGGQR